MSPGEDLPVSESVQQQSEAIGINGVVAQARPLLESLQSRQQGLGLVAEGKLPDDHPTLPGAVVSIRPYYRSVADDREAGTWGVTIGDLDARIAGPHGHDGQVHVTVKPMGGARRDATEAESQTVASALAAMYQAWSGSTQIPEEHPGRRAAPKRQGIAQQMARLLRRAA
jgi:hypothetical protein